MLKTTVGSTVLAGILAILFRVITGNCVEHSLVVKNILEHLQIRRCVFVTENGQYCRTLKNVIKAIPTAVTDLNSVKTRILQENYVSGKTSFVFHQNAYNSSLTRFFDELSYVSYE